MAQKMVTFVVGGTSYEWPDDNIKITYGQVVALDVPGFSQQPEIKYSVTYEGGYGKTGTLAPGASCWVKDGMIFDVKEIVRS